MENSVTKSKRKAGYQSPENPFNNNESTTAKQSKYDKNPKKKDGASKRGRNVALGKMLLWNVMYTAKFAGKFQQLVTSPTFFQQMQTLP